MKFKYVKYAMEDGIILDKIEVDSALELIKCIFLMNKNQIIRELKGNKKRSKK